MMYNVFFDVTQRVVSLKQVNYDMVSHVAKARVAIEELKNFFVGDSLESINKKLDKYYMVLILRSLHSDFDHVRDQVLASDQILSMDGLVTQLLQRPILVDENLSDAIETSTMVAPRERGRGRNNRGGCGGGSGHPQCSYFRKEVKNVTIKATYKEDIIRFKISLNCGIVELKEEIAKRLKLEEGTFDIKYHDDDHEWILIACDADLQECMDISRSSGSNIIRLVVHDILPILGSSCESSGDWKAFAIRKEVKNVTIKATSKEDMIRFKISLNCGIVELKEEIAKRLKLEDGTFDIKYLDDDHEWVLIACDADLQECMNISRPSGRNVIRLVVHDILPILGSSCESSGD